jgi:hypothetical protein
MRFGSNRSFTKIGIFTVHFIGLNALKLIYVHLHFKKFPGVTPPLHKGREGEGDEIRNGRKGIKGRAGKRPGEGLVGGGLLHCAWGIDAPGFHGASDTDETI